MKGKTEKHKKINCILLEKPGNGRSLEADAYHIFDQAI